jgi:hypothetical protein
MPALSATAVAMPGTLPASVAKVHPLVRALPRRARDPSGAQGLGTADALAAVEGQDKAAWRGDPRRSPLHALRIAAAPRG